MIDWKREAEAQKEYTIALRRELHQHPELGLQEHRTARRIEEELDNLAIPHERVEETGVLDVIARFISSVSGGSAPVIGVIILWVSAVTSAFVDNIPFAATMIRSSV